MKKFAHICLIFLFIFLLSGCSKTTVTPAPTYTIAAPTNVPATQPVLKTVETPTTAPAASNSAEDEPTVIADEETSSPTAVHDQVQPSLFNITWDDRSLFRAGLIPTEQAVLDQMPQATVYLMALTLADSLTTVTGSEEIRYTNQETVPLDEIVFHLYPSLLGGTINVTDVQINGRSAPSLPETANSILRIPLTDPLSPDSSVVIQLTFQTDIPQDDERNYSVFTFQENILALAHFYPMIAAYDENGWDTEMPVPQGDLTYADSSFYLVRITAPDNVTLATSGIEVETNEGGAVSHTFAAGPMRDFYVAASPDYVVFSSQIGDVHINSFAPARYEDAATAVLDYAMAALDIYGTRFTPYPFTELDIVSTPTQALGIEYPGIIVNTLRIYDLEASTGPLPNSIRLESTTAHEVGHQWFYSLVGNDQLDEPWLDESLTQYVTYLYYLDNSGPGVAQAFYNSLQGNWGTVDQADIPIGLPVASYHGNEYGAIVYGRGPIFIHQLAQTMGETTFDEFLRAYVNKFKWGIATGSEFQAMAEAQCECDLTDLFITWVFPKNE